ncbi:carbohydrate ABC transporter permease [Paenibacillus sp. SYP-B4298]|uniref:carbohydrate ABC transporter permease n=1 Tax=Paenibacillus sp. SYP-B4298 TaxID=2996034 RepID=UPI0022DCE6AC|nr:sugar ABC transporter permease [Paenibacillus sp. SYP-B4298]
MDRTASAGGRRRRARGSGFVRYWIKEWSSWLLVVPSVLFFLFFSWEPLLRGIYLSFFETRGFEPVRFIGLQNYVDVVSHSVFWQILRNTFVYVFWSLVLGFFVPIAVAILVNEMRWLQSFFRVSAYFPSMVPGIAAAMLWMFLFEPSEHGLVNMALGLLGIAPLGWLQDSSLTIVTIVLTMTWRGFGAIMLLFLANLQSINNELYEAAAIDGASIRHKLAHIMLPHISPLIGLTLILQISGVFQIFNEPLVLTEGGPNNASMTLQLQSYFYAFRYFEAGRSVALGVITFLILMVITLVFFRLQKKVSD